MREKRKDQNSLAAVFGKKLMTLRKDHHLSQYELADKIGLSRSTIAYYEAWAKNPTLDILQRVADFFDVSPTTLIETDYEKENKKPQSLLEKQFKKLQTLSPKKQRLIANMLEGALKE